MSSVNEYNASFWSKRIPQYLDESWSTEPSPFAQVVATYLDNSSVVLELGCGAGQDGTWLAKHAQRVVLSDGQSLAFSEIETRAKNQQTNNIELKVVDLTETLPFPDQSFDMVYCQLVLHYFDDQKMNEIMQEIHRVLKPNGIFACMVNSVNDPEYQSEKPSHDGLIDVGGLIKRYFDLETFRPFITAFEILVFDMEGRTPKDDAVNTSGMVRFIGKKHG